MFVDICVGCLQCFYFMFCHCMGIIHTALGIVSIVLSAIVQKRMNEAFDYFDSQEDHIGQSLMIAMWALSSFILFCGLIDLICCCQKHAFFQLLPLYVQIACLVYGIFAMSFVDTINDMKNQNCSQPQWSENLESAYIWAKAELCQSECLCYIADKELAIFYGVKNYTLTPINVNKVQNCPINIQNYTNQIDFLGYAENKFKCAGWCQKQKYYMFTDINQLVPSSETQGCFKNTLSHFADNFYLLGWFAYSINLFEALLGLMSSFARCCLNEALADF